MDPFLAISEEAIAFAHLPYRYRVLSETGVLARSKVLERDALRKIRHRQDDTEDNTFYEEFDMAVAAYQQWNLSRRGSRIALRYILIR